MNNRHSTFRRGCSIWNKKRKKPLGSLGFPPNPRFDDWLNRFSAEIKSFRINNVNWRQSIGVTLASVAASICVRIAQAIPPIHCNRIMPNWIKPCDYLLSAHDQFNMNMSVSGACACAAMVSNADGAAASKFNLNRLQCNVYATSQSSIRPYNFDLVRLNGVCVHKLAEVEASESGDVDLCRAAMANWCALHE